MNVGLLYSTLECINISIKTHNTTTVAVSHSREPRERDFMQLSFTHHCSLSFLVKKPYVSEENNSSSLFQIRTLKLSLSLSLPCLNPPVLKIKYKTRNIVLCTFFSCFPQLHTFLSLT